MTAITAILAGWVYTPTQEIIDGTILIKGHVIAKVGRRSEVKIPSGAAVIENQDRIAVPGFIDLHIHGAAGHDVMEATPESLSAVAGYLARHGTTSFLPTTITASLDRTLRSARGLAEIIRGWETSGGGAASAGAQPIGIHFEGPFLNVEKRGAHPAAHILKPSVDALERLLEAAAGTARVLTLAPEIEGADAVLRHACRAGISVGIGHSNATYGEAERAISAGANHATHIYNAMRAFSHHDPGIIGAVLTDDRASAELICDGIHVEPPAVRLLVRAKGLERVILVSDGLSAAGMPDGAYRLGGFTIHVGGGVCRTEEGTLAGSTLSSDAALRNLASSTGLSYRQCLPCATLNPARLIGVEKHKGVLAPGADADIAILDQNYYMTQAYVRGRPAL